MDSLLTAGEFAKMCGTTKATLRWYRRLRLLDPALVRENGYAYYNPSQMMTFIMIQALQRVGCSLDEIKRYQERALSDSSDSFFSTQIERLDEKIAELKRQRQYLSQMQESQKALHENWKALEPSSWKIRDIEEQYYLVFQAPTIPMALYQERLLSFQKICSFIGLGEDVPIMMYLPYEALKEENYDGGFCIGTALPDPAPIQDKLDSLTGFAIKPSLMVRPAGKYLTYLSAVPLNVDGIPKITYAEDNPLRNGQEQAIRTALREGADLEFGLTEKYLTALPDQGGLIRLLFEISIKMKL